MTTTGTGNSTFTSSTFYAWHVSPACDVCPARAAFQLEAGGVTVKLCWSHHDQLQTFLEGVRVAVRLGGSCRLPSGAVYRPRPGAST